METTGLKIGKELEIIYKTTLKMLKIFRENIKTSEIKKDFAGEIELDESYFGGRSKKNIEKIIYLIV